MLGTVSTNSPTELHPQSRKKILHEPFVVSVSGECSTCQLFLRMIYLDRMYTRKCVVYMFNVFGVMKLMMKVTYLIFILASKCWLIPALCLALGI